jgi:hypothetical protein
VAEAQLGGVVNKECEESGSAQGCEDVQKPEHELEDSESGVKGAQEAAPGPPGLDSEAA